MLAWAVLSMSLACGRIGFETTPFTAPLDSDAAPSGSGTGAGWERDADASDMAPAPGSEASSGRPNDSAAVPDAGEGGTLVSPTPSDAGLSRSDSGFGGPLDGTGARAADTGMDAASGAPADSGAPSEPVADADDPGPDVPPPSLDMAPDAGADASPDADTDAAPEMGVDAGADSGMSDAATDTMPGWRSAIMPYPSGAATSVVLADGLHYLGGGTNYFGNTRYQDHYVYSVATGIWSATPADVPDNVTWGANGHAYGGQLYLVGGFPNGNRLRVFDPIGNGWTNLRMPTDRLDWGCASGVMGTYLYAFGGYPHATTNAPGHRYDFAVNRWFAVAPIPLNHGGGSLSSAVVGTRLYVLNGNQDDGTTVLQIYDSGTNTWSFGASLLGHLFERAAAAVLGTDVYFVGGAANHDLPDSAPGQPVAVTNRVNIYNTVSNTWTVGPPMMTARMWATAVTYQSELHVFGGFGADINQINSHEVYAP